MGDDLPVELILRDWTTGKSNGTGGRACKQGDCYAIYQKLYETGAPEQEERNTFLM